MDMRSRVNKSYKNLFVFSIITIFALVFISGMGSALNWSLTDNYEITLGKYVSLNGSQYINISNSSSLQIANNSYSIGVSFLKDGAITASEFLLGKDGSATAKSTDVFIFTSGSAISRIADITLTTSSVNTSSWNNLLFRYIRDPTISSGGRSYVNGIASGGSVNISSKTNNNISDFSLLIGRRGAGGFYNGSLGKVYIYNSSLTNNIVNYLYETDIYGARNTQIPIIYYHQIDSGDPSIDTNTTDFADQISFLNASGFKTISYKNFTDYQRGLQSLPEKPIIINFDDGYDNVYYNATPILNKYNYTATVGIITEFSGKTGFLNWTQLEELKDLGWEMVSHSLQHNVTLNLSYDERQINFNMSKQQIIGNLSVIPIAFIYPENRFNESINEECLRYYEFCLGTQVGANTMSYNDKNTDLRNASKIYRMGVYNSTNMFLFKQALYPYSQAIVNIDFNASNSSTVIDISGNNNNGVIVGGINYYNYTVNESDIWVFNRTYELQFINRNLTNSKSFKLEEANKALILFANNSGVICTGVCNVTLLAKNTTLVLDNFNLTEGVTRQFSPLTFSQSTLSEKHIASTLSQTVTTSVILSPVSTWGNNCENVNKMVYTTDSGIKTTWNGENARTICRQFISSGVALSIEPAVNSNVLSWETGTSNMSSNILKLVIGFIALLVVLISVAGVFMYFKTNGSSMDIKQMLTMFIILLIVVVLAGMLVDYIYGVL